MDFGGQDFGASSYGQPSGDMSKGKGKSRHADPAEANPENAAPPALVQSIKDMQRKDPDAKDQWIAYTDYHGSGRRDPSKHTEQFLNNFLEQYNSGARLALHEDAKQAGDLTKFCIQRSEAFKDLWGQYCQHFGKSDLDPAQHEPVFHVKFLSFLAEKASQQESAMGGDGMGGGGMSGEGFDGSAMKRPRLDGPGMGEGSDPSKEQLVAQVKLFQRQSEESGELWRIFCETNMGGVLDPNRHEASVLQHFLDTYGGGFQDMPAAQMQLGLGHPRGDTAPAFPTGDPEKDEVVIKIKAFQRLGQENKDAWYGWCGKVRDPARHETMKLLEFCQLYGIS